MPVLAHPEYTRAAISDVLAQTVPVRLLIINQGVDEAFREELEKIAEASPDRVLVWSHQPPLPSLAATWNRALAAVWEASTGDTAGWVALVVNNDVRLRPDTIAMLRTVQDQTDALFVSCVGVTPEDFARTQKEAAIDLVGDLTQLGGPDFSCFLISFACHDRFRFDEHFIPAFCEDLDYHRRLLLAGEGARIFSINLPYLHYGSATIKALEPKSRAATERAIETGSRAYYARKWGGPVNAERYRMPRAVADTDHLSALDLDALYDGRDDGTATTPYLQAHPPVEAIHYPAEGLTLLRPLEGGGANGQVDR